MKRIIFIVLILLSGLSFAQSTLPVIPFGQRKADLYYWDTNWYDRYEQLHPNEPVYPSHDEHIIPTDVGNYFLARACMAETPILVKGIAGTAVIRARNTYLPTLDTTLSGRNPEWFKLLDANLNLLGDGRWDTVSPTYRMEFRREIHRDTLNVYEVFFDKPVLVSGLFYVGGTARNNLRLGATADDPYGYDKFEHLFTYYYGYYGGYSGHYGSPTYSKCPPSGTDVILYRYLWPSMAANGGNAIYDTTSYMYYDGLCLFYPFFAIIDTNYVYYDCQQPTGLRVEYADEDSVVVAWNNASAEMWNVMVWPDGIEPDSGMHFTVQTNRLTMYGLDISQNYNIKVMSVCDTFHCNTSDWSNVFQMRVCDHIVCPVPDGLIAEPLAGDGRVIVVWNHMDVDLYELAIWNDNENEDSATLIQSTLEYVMLDDLDTALWYNAKIRSGCDECGNISEWSDTVKFYVPNLHPDSGDTTAINDVVARHTHLMPNPTSDRVTVVSSYQLQKVELFGTDGKLIVSFDTNGLSAEIDLSAYPSGTYIVRIRTNAGVATKRLVKR
ncbi:MAG: T9SS type A sorting domain-containing protein [Bacteroidales bacterium]|nr:T9SS type A sorting domain-containing protein [Bacteroidales bacterium]